MRTIAGKLLPVLILAGLAGLALAQETKRADRAPMEFAPYPWPMMRVGMEVLVNGQPAPLIHHAGKTYLPVRRLGDDYTIRISNQGPRRIVAIVSVDGLSVINGQPASEEHPGYIVMPHSNIVIKGWRRNMETVAAFTFEERDKSYAALMGRPENIGVIGLIAIEEFDRRPRPALERYNGAGPSTAQRFSDSGKAGTGYGRDVDSPIYYVPFVRSSNKRNITFYYDTVEALRRAGAPVDRPVPDPFPRDHEFVPPPPGDPRR